MRSSALVALAATKGLSPCLCFFLSPCLSRVIDKLPLLCAMSSPLSVALVEVLLCESPIAIKRQIAHKSFEVQQKIRAGTSYGMHGRSARRPKIRS